MNRVTITKLLNEYIYNVDVIQYFIYALFLIFGILLTYCLRKKKTMKDLSLAIYRLQFDHVYLNLKLYIYNYDDDTLTFYNNLETLCYNLMNLHFDLFNMKLIKLHQKYKSTTTERKKYTQGRKLVTYINQQYDLHRRKLGYSSSSFLINFKNSSFTYKLYCIYIWIFSSFIIFFLLLILMELLLTNNSIPFYNFVLNNEIFIYILIVSTLTFSSFLTSKITF